MLQLNTYIHFLDAIIYLKRCEIACIPGNVGTCHDFRWQLEVGKAQEYELSISSKLGTGWSIAFGSNAMHTMRAGYIAKIALSNLHAFTNSPYIIVYV